MRRRKIRKIRRKGNVLLRYRCYWNAEGVHHELLINKKLIIKKQIHPYGTVEVEEIRKLSDIDTILTIKRLQIFIEKYPQMKIIEEDKNGSFEADILGHSYEGPASSRLYKYLNEILERAYDKAKLIDIKE